MTNPTTTVTVTLTATLTVACSSDPPARRMPTSLPRPTPLTASSSVCVPCGGHSTARAWAGKAWAPSQTPRTAARAPHRLQSSPPSYGLPPLSAAPRGPASLQSPPATRAASAAARLIRVSTAGAAARLAAAACVLLMNR